MRKSIPTIIRHKETAKGFAVVVTNVTSSGIEASTQSYIYSGNSEGRTALDYDMPWSSEAAAIEDFNKIN